MTLPAYLPPMVVSQSQMSASLDDSSRRSGISSNTELNGVVPALSEGSITLTDRPVQQPGEAQVAGGATAQRDQSLFPALDTLDTLDGAAEDREEAATTTTDRQANAMKQLSEIQLRLEATKPLDLPVPVTQILQIVLADGKTDSVGTPPDPGPLYEGVQEIISLRIASDVPLAA